MAKTLLTTANAERYESAGIMQSLWRQNGTLRERVPGLGNAATFEQTLGDERAGGCLIYLHAPHSFTSGVACRTAEEALHSVVKAVVSKGGNGLIRSANEYADALRAFANAGYPDTDSELYATARSGYYRVLGLPGLFDDTLRAYSEISDRLVSHMHQGAILVTYGARPFAEALDASLLTFRARAILGPLGRSFSVVTSVEEEA